MNFTLERTIEGLTDHITIKTIFSVLIVMIGNVLELFAPIEGLVNTDSRLVVGAILVFLLDLISGVWAAIRDRRFAWGKGFKLTAIKASTYAIFGITMAIVSNMFSGVALVSVLTDHAFNFAVAWMIATDTLSILENILILERVQRFLKALLPVVRGVSAPAAEVAENLTSKTDDESTKKPD